MPPLEKGLLLELSSPPPPPGTMLLTSASPPSRSSSSTSTSSTTNTTTSSAIGSPSTIEKMASSTALFARRSSRHFLRQSATTSTNLFNSNKPKEILRTSKKVHFDLANGPSSSEPRVEMKLIPHVKEFDQETRSKVWFTHHELEETMKEATRTIIAVNDGVLFTDDDPDFTTRGLEYMTPTGFNIANSSQQAVTTVLQEQERQRNVPNFNGQLDDHLLADSIQAMSRHRQRIAHLAAMKDARTVHGPGNFRCQVAQLHPPEPIIGVEGGRQQQRQDPQGGNLRASGSMEDIRRRRQVSRISSARREHRHSAPSPGSDPIVKLSPQLWRNSLS